jgi:hypothetical protein
MASYILFNIQLLPSNTKSTKEVGEEGYKKLFERLREATIQAFKKKNLKTISFELANEASFAPRSTIVMDDHAYGEWLRYHRSDSVEDLYSSEKLFEAAKGTFPITNRYTFEYVFDYKTHRMALSETAGRLPAPDICHSALEHIFEEVSKGLFPKHILKINLVSDSTKLEQVLAEAEGYKKVSTTLTFPNGHNLGKRLQELKDNNVHHLKVEASAGSKETAMPQLPGFLKELVEASVSYGKTYISYIAETGGKILHYASSKYPAKIRLRSRKNEQPAELRRRVINLVRGINEATAESDDDI